MLRQNFLTWYQGEHKDSAEKVEAFSSQDAAIQFFSETTMFDLTETDYIFVEDPNDKSITLWEVGAEIDFHAYRTDGEYNEQEID